MMSPILVELRASSGDFMAKMGAAEERIALLQKRGSSSFDKLAAAGKAAFLGIGVLAVGVGGVAVKAALAGEQAHAKLAQAVHNVGGRIDEIDPKVAALTDKYAKLGYSHSQVEEALAVLTTALRDPQKALDNLGLATDLARFKNIPLSESSLIVAKALEGQLRPLKALGIDLPVAAGGALKLEQAHAKLTKAQDDYNAKLAAYHSADAPHARAAALALHAAVERVKDAQQKLNDTQAVGATIQQGLTTALGGQAQAAANTYAGRLRAAGASAENLAEKLGNVLLPKIAAVLDKTVALVGWFEKHRTTSMALALVIGGPLTVAMGAFVVKQAIAIVQMNILIARTAANAAVTTVATALWYAASGALLAEAGAAATLATSLLAVAAAAAAAVAAYQYFATEQDLANQEKHGEAQDAKTAQQRAYNHSPAGLAAAAANKARRDAAAAAAARAAAAANAVGGSVPTPALYDPTIPPPSPGGTSRAAATAKAVRAAVAAQAARDAARAAQQAKEAAARDRAMSAEIRQRNEIIRLMTVQMRLSQRMQDLSLVNNAVYNGGASFAQAAAHHTTVNVNIAGSLVTYDDVHRGTAAYLQKTTRQNVTSGVG